MHFSQSKSTKCEIFAWNCDFSGTTYHRDSLNPSCGIHWIWHASNPKYAPLKPFQCIYPSQNQQNDKFLGCCWTPPDKKLKKLQIPVEHQFGKSVRKGLKICTYRFLGIPFAMHYVRTLCDKWLFELWWFSFDFWQEG